MKPTVRSKNRPTLDVSVPTSVTRSLDPDAPSPVEEDISSLVKRDYLIQELLVLLEDTKRGFIHPVEYGLPALGARLNVLKELKDYLPSEEMQNDEEEADLSQQIDFLTRLIEQTEPDDEVEDEVRTDDIVPPTEGSETPGHLTELAAERQADYAHRAEVYGVQPPKYDY